MGNYSNRMSNSKFSSKKFEFYDKCEHFEEYTEIKVPCEYCDKLVCLEDMEYHIDEICDLVKEKCILGCGVKLFHQEMSSHLRDKCEFRILTCDHCSEGFRSVLCPHGKKCPNVKVSCKLSAVRSCVEKIWYNT